MFVGSPPSDRPITTVGTAVSGEAKGSLDGEFSSGTLVLDDTDGSFEGCGFVGVSPPVGPFVFD
jgi:hypothetical protein